MPFCGRDEVRSIRLQEIARYLEGKRAPNGRILRADIDPVIDIPRNASLLMLVEQTAGGRQRARLVGSKAAEIIGGDCTGKWIDEFAPPPGGEDDILGRVFESDEMFFGRVRLPWDARRRAEVEWLAQRLRPSSDSRDGDGVGRLAVLAIDQRMEIEQPGN